MSILQAHKNEFSQNYWEYLFYNFMHSLFYFKIVNFNIN
jgi:hypothetical protein